MTCVEAEELMAGSWMGELDTSAASQLQEHLAHCDECRADMTQLSAMWQAMGDLPAPQPRRRRTWNPRPVWQFAIAACLLIGMALEAREIARLRHEVAGTKELVALSLLQQGSATGRLRGVDYSVRMRTLEPEVAAALISAVNRDPNTSVRLAAIDALTRASGDPQVRRSIGQSLGAQESPMVQIALIDYLVDARDRQSLATLRTFARRDDLNPDIRRHADTAVRRLTEYK